MNGQLRSTCSRTLARLFLREVGMSFGEWRKRARLLLSMGRLAAGASILEVALEHGYQSSSAFSAMLNGLWDDQQASTNKFSRYVALFACVIDLIESEQLAAKRYSLSSCAFINGLKYNYLLFHIDGGPVCVV